MFSFASLLIFSSLAVGSAFLGVWLTSIPDIARRVIPLSGAILVAVSLFWVLPELILEFGFFTGAGLMILGFAVLLIIDRYIYAVCPACSHTHDHDSCRTPLHGFAGPLIAAALLHSFFDGWILAAGNEQGAGPLGPAILLGVALHKLPEGLAFGVIVRAALKSRSRAFLCAGLVQGIMLAGGVSEHAAAPYLGNRWVAVLLAFGGGTFLYLGYHAVHAEWKRRFSPHKHASLSSH
ncbi:MAG: ZIP family metal transporter [Bryobacteraceae bacterium]